MKEIETPMDEMNAKLQEYMADCEHLPYGVGIVKNDAHSTIIQANTAFYQLLGHTKQQMQEQYGNRIIDILIDNVYNQIEQTTPDGDCDFGWDLRIRAADGAIRWIHDFAHYNTELDVFFVTLTDITDKLLIPGSNLSYEAFQTKHEILSYMAKYTSEHIVVSDAITDEVVYMNPMAMKLLDFHNEGDWRGKKYVDIMFGAQENIHPDYYKMETEDTFVAREYYNTLHRKYTHTESKYIMIPALNRKMRLHILTDITAQNRLEQRITLHKTLQECIEPLFSAGTADKDPQDAYYDILNKLKVYYQADSTFFYKFVDGTHEVEVAYRVTAHGERGSHTQIPLVASDAQIELLQALSKVTPDQQQSVLDAFGEVYQESLIQLNLDYKMGHFSCITLSNTKGEIIAFMGAANPRLHDDNNGLLELLSRFICMFMEHQQDLEVKEEALTLEAVSKANLIEKCTKNFQSLDNAKDNINDSLDALCNHYDADFAIVLSRDEESGTYRVPYVGGQSIPDTTEFTNQPSHAMDKWMEIFNKYSQFITDADLDEPFVKALLKEKFGIRNFIVSPMLDGNDVLRGMLFVINFKLMNRAHFMVHVVAKNIYDYIDRIVMFQKSQLEPATQLANKVTTQYYISKSLEEGNMGSLFVIDIDNFKRLNDTLGHQVGDQALVDFAGILKQIFRTTDIIGRIGGDEFMIFCPALVSTSLIETKANQVLAQCKRTYEKDGLAVEISASVGICCADGKRKTFQPLYLNADYALYISKKSGKNRYHIYSDAEYLEDASATDDLRFYHNVVNALKSAIKEQRFIVHYQPLYHVPSATFTQAEALVRLEKPDGTLVYPSDFIQVAESTGLVVEMTYQILEQVCFDFRRLLNQQPNTKLSAISINVPYLQFTDPNMEEQFLKILGKYDISPSQIKLEITERTIIADMDLMTRKMASMIETGFRFELDDFGTDYSNLRMCVTLPLDIVKLDRSLLLAALETDTGRCFFGHILAGLHDTGCHTIMEGVETQEQLDWATECNCEYIQGYYFSKPVDFDGFYEALMQ